MPRSPRVPSPRAGHDDACAQVVWVDLGGRLALAGHLDVHSSTDVRLALAAAVEAGEGELVVDLSGVVSADATGIGVLVGAHRHAGRRGRTLLLAGVPDQVLRLLTRTRLNRVLHLQGDPA